MFSSICFASYNARGEQTDLLRRGGVPGLLRHLPPRVALCVSGTSDKDPIAADGYWARLSASEL